MNTISRQLTGAAAITAIAMMTAGCDQRHPNETTGQKIDRATDKVAATTKDATTKAANAADDAAVTAKVKAALFAEPGLKTLQIEVETHEAVVTLAGSVESESLRQRVVQIAGSLNGVRNAVHNLVIKSS